MRGSAGGQAQGLHADQHLGAMHHDQAVGRAHKVHAGPAVLQLVAHDLGDGQLGQGFVQRLLHAIGQQHALGRGFVEQGFGLAFALALQSGHCGFVGPQGRQFLEQCRRGLALGIQRHGDRHQLLRDSLVFGLGQHFGDVRGQTAGRGVGGQARLARCQQSLGLELLEDDSCKSIAELLQRLGRQLFDKQFNQ